MNTRRLWPLLGLTLAWIALAGCGGGAEPADTTETAGAADSTQDEHGHTHAPGEEHDHAHDPGTGAGTGGTGHTHQEGVVAEESATRVMVAPEASYDVSTTDGWSVAVVSTPELPAIGTVAWQVTVQAPGGAAVTPGQLLIEPEAQEINSGKNLPLQVTQGEPGQATVAFVIEAPGTYEVEFHLHRSDGGDSHVKYAFTVL